MILDSWGLDSKQIIALLDLPGKANVRTLNRYRQGVAELPRCEQVNNRLEHLLAIIEALRTTFPRNIQMGSHWMNKPLRRFSRRKPVSVLVDDGMPGLMAVRAHLDCTYSWDY